MKRLTGIAQLSKLEIQALLEPGDTYPLSGSVGLVFHEPSTRTRFSFSVACLRAGLIPIDLNPGSSSEQKGETTIDTCKNLVWAGASALVLRTSENLLPERVADVVGIPVINAGDGTNEHPTQALGDALTLIQHFGSIEGLTIAIVGDVFFSRVARSNAYLLTKLGARVHFVSPDAADVPNTVPRHLNTNSLAEGLKGADAVMILRWQGERRVSGQYKGSYYCLDEEKMCAYTSPSTIVMHPGPVNRGVEVTSELIDGPRSWVRMQVENGVAARERVLRYLLS